MKSKNVMKVANFNSSGYAIEAHKTSYLDKEFYDLFNPESSSNKDLVSCSVIVNAIDAGWMLKEEDGDKFLLALSECENMNYFESDIVRILILFLWRKYKPLIITHLFFPFLANFFLFNFYALFTFVMVRTPYDPNDAELSETAYKKWNIFFFVLNEINLIFLLTLTVYIVYIEYK
mmetsp:Transcript_3135/g.3017  ORF Transcript_3135/g.3017 Transcript_3135/m.3017 type:complete len:176 (+) Transcript_3135:4119-4646(+)